MGKKECLCGRAATLVYSCFWGGNVGAISYEADRIIMIDGCPLNCGWRTLEGASICGSTHVHVTDLGLTKGDAPPTEINIEQVASTACAAAGTGAASSRPAQRYCGG